MATQTEDNINSTSNDSSREVSSTDESLTNKESDLEKKETSSFSATNNNVSFTSLLTNMLPHDKVIAIRQDQAQMLQTLELSNWKLSSLNEISESTYQKCSLDFRQTSKMLIDMKKQLDSIFRRIRHLKAQVAANYPEAYATISAKYKEEYNEFDEEEER